MQVNQLNIFYSLLLYKTTFALNNSYKENITNVGHFLVDINIKPLNSTHFSQKKINITFSAILNFVT